MKIVDNSINFQEGLGSYPPRGKEQMEISSRVSILDERRCSQCREEMEQVRQDSVP
jgi:hypothetical protein